MSNATATPALPTTASTTKDGKKPDKLGIIQISKIRQNVVALRPVQKDSEDYLGLVDSVKKNGIFQSILVREFADPDKPNEVLYGLIDGLQRYNAAMDAGLTEIPAKITDMGQAEIEETQIIANAQKIETKPFQYAQQIDRLLQRNPTLSVIELSGKISKPTAWIYKMLGLLTRLHGDIQPMVDAKELTLSNSVELAKLPIDEQKEWLDKAKTMEPAEFTANVATRVKNIKEARRKGKVEGPATFEPVAHQRKYSEVKTQYDAGCAEIIALARRANIKTVDDAIKLAIAWSCMMDPESQIVQREADVANKAKATADKDRKTLEKTVAKEAEAKKTREELERKVAEREAADKAAAPAATKA